MIFFFLKSYAFDSFYKPSEIVTEIENSIEERNGGLEFLPCAHPAQMHSVVSRVGAVMAPKAQPFGGASAGGGCVVTASTRCPATPPPGLGTRGRQGATPGLLTSLPPFPGAT